MRAVTPSTVAETKISPGRNGVRLPAESIVAAPRMLLLGIER
jgi:hypothetical protein